MGQFKYIFLLIAATLMSSCARILPLNGGEVDKVPPRILPELSSPNSQVNFTGREFVLTFDEWIVLDKIDQVLLISPPLQYKPKVSQKGKSVYFKLDEKEMLRPVTTYIINFGTAIRDLNEGNILRDYKYVFSTGSMLDSLSREATLISATDQKPLPETLLMLYSGQGDSLVYQDLPDYAGRSDSSGRVVLDYLKQGDYEAIALKDLNSNYKYDLTDELIGFSTERISVPGVAPIRIQLFSKDIPARLAQVDSSSPSKLRLLTDQTTEGWQIKAYKDHVPLSISRQEKYYDLYYPDTSGRISFILDRPLSPPDSLDLSVNIKKARGRQFAIDEVNKSTLIAGKPLKIRLYNLLAGLDTSLVIVKSKSGRKINAIVSVDLLETTRVLVSADWKTDSTYTVLFRTGSLKDRRGYTNSDSLTLTAKAINPEVLGSITFRLDSLKPEYDYLIKLVQGKVAYGSWSVTGQSQFSAIVADLSAGTYELTIGEDRNKNGRIDGGNFNDRRAPEKTFRRSLEPLRENWSVEAEVNMNSFK